LTVWNQLLLAFSPGKVGTTESTHSGFGAEAVVQNTSSAPIRTMGFEGRTDDIGNEDVDSELIGKCIRQDLGIWLYHVNSMSRLNQWSEVRTMLKPNAS